MLRVALSIWIAAWGGALFASANPPGPSGEGRTASPAREDRSVSRIDLGPIREWIAMQSDLKTVESRFVQTRTLRALKSPVAIPGRLWFRRPDAFRWELGDPAKSIMIRDGGALYLIQPQRKRAKKMTVEELAQQAGVQGLAMMEFPMASDFDDFKRQFDVLSIETDGRQCSFSVAPRDLGMKKFMRRVDVTFDRRDGALVEFSMTFRDGSSMTNRFTEVKMNAPVARGLFEYDFSGYSFADAGD